MDEEKIGVSPFTTGVFGPGGSDGETVNEIDWCVCSKCGKRKRRKEGTSCQDILCSDCDIAMTGGLFAGVKVEVTENYIHVPAPGQEGKHSGHDIKTKTLSEAKGILGRYCVDCKTMVTYLFAKDHDWTRAEAVEWVEEHKDQKTVLTKSVSLPYRMSVVKGADGRDYCWMITGSAFRDLEDEIISRQAIDYSIHFSDMTGFRGDADLYHIDGTEWGECVYQYRQDKVLVELHRFKDNLFAQKVKRWLERIGAKELESVPGASVTFYYEPEFFNSEEKVYDRVIIFKRALLMQEDAAFPWSTAGLAVKELSEDSCMSRKEALGEILDDAELAERILEEAAEVSKNIEEQGVAFKDAESEEPEATEESEETSEEVAEETVEEVEGEETAETEESETTETKEETETEAVEEESEVAEVEETEVEEVADSETETKEEEADEVDEAVEAERAEVETESEEDVEEKEVDGKKKIPDSYWTALASDLADDPMQDIVSIHRRIHMWAAQGAVPEPLTKGQLVKVHNMVVAELKRRFKKENPDKPYEHDSPLTTGDIKKAEDSDELESLEEAEKCRGWNKFMGKLRALFGLKSADGPALGGATSIPDAREWLASTEEATSLSNTCVLFGSVMSNILGSEAVTDKREALREAATDFLGMLYPEQGAKEPEAAKEVEETLEDLGAEEAEASEEVPEAETVEEPQSWDLNEEYVPTFKNALGIEERDARLDALEEADSKDKERFTNLESGQTQILEQLAEIGERLGKLEAEDDEKIEQKIRRLPANMFRPTRSPEREDKEASEQEQEKDSGEFKETPEERDERLKGFFQELKPVTPR